jgi:ABC-type uncharacterized transport system fused permease/ATPase subunit
LARRIARKNLNRFDRVFWKKVWALIRLYWSSSQRRLGVKLLASVAVLSGVAIALGAYSSYLSRDSTNALVGKHLPEFNYFMLIWIVVAGVGVLAKVFGDYFGALLYIEWRQWLTHYFIDAGFAHLAFYRMGMVGKVDNSSVDTRARKSAYVGWEADRYNRRADEGPKHQNRIG